MANLNIANRQTFRYGTVRGLKTWRFTKAIYDVISLSGNNM